MRRNGLSTFLVKLCGILWSWKYRNNFGRCLDHYWLCKLLVGAPFAWLLHLWCNAQGRRAVGLSLVCRKVVALLFGVVMTCAYRLVILVGIYCQQVWGFFVLCSTTVILKKFFTCYECSQIFVPILEEFF